MDSNNKGWEGFLPDKSTVQVKESLAWLRGTDEPAVAGDTTDRGMGKRHNPGQ